MTFWLNGTEAGTADTVAGGTASLSLSLPAGVYHVEVKVTACPDCVYTGDGGFLVVYDPSGGFCHGWRPGFDSPPGAYMADPLLAGKATFGFVSKYQKGATVPTGNTEFQFQAGNLRFKSTSYDWLVVNQNYANAQFKGFGTINGAGNYGFMIWAGDGASDTFRINILARGEPSRLLTTMVSSRQSAAEAS